MRNEFQNIVRLLTKKKKFERLAEILIRYSNKTLNISDEGLRKENENEDEEEDK